MCYFLLPRCAAAAGAPARVPEVAAVFGGEQDTLGKLHNIC